MYSTISRYANLSPIEFLTSINQEALFELLTNHEVVFNIKLTSFFREDNTPNCYYSYDWNGVLRFVDFSLVNPHINLINAVQLIYKCNYLDARIILEELIHTGISNKEFQKDVVKPIKTGERSLIKCEYRNFDIRDKMFWKDKYDITVQNLLDDRVYPVKKYITYSLRMNDYFIVNPIDIAYAYTDFIDNGKKIYRPFNKDHKWVSNLTSKDIGNISNLEFDFTEYIVVTKAYKDCRIIRNLGFENVIWTQNEMCFNSKELLDLLSTYKKVFIIYDNDEPGIEGSNKFIQLLSNNNIDSESILIPQSVNNIRTKDLSDYYEQARGEKTKLLINKYVKHNK